VPPKLVLIRSGDRRLLSRAVESGFTHFLLDGEAGPPGSVETYHVRDGEVWRGRKRVGHYVRIEDRADEEKIRRLKGKDELVVVEPRNWKVIPLENLVAALDGRTRLIAVARDAREARLFFETLERGVDGVVVEPRTAKDLADYRKLLAPPAPALSLVAATVTRLEPLGMGERVCVDTCNVFEPGEGLLVGSTSRGFFLVAAECYESEYVAARPFRVNAGAVHSYLWSGDRTKYLSEVRAGLALEAVDAKGRRRPVVVGRAKIETRPLLLVEAEAGGRKANVVLQNAETIRLVQPSGRAKSVSRLKVGDRVLLHPETGARHFGMKIEERIQEL
jgi:3-dehydroquinate synthase II